jgi:DNA-binding NtrC family response regulator
VDVRVLAATNKDLLKEIEAGRFREDLYYRLNVVELRSPPLRERCGDIPDLARSFLAEACTRNGKRPMALSGEALAQLEGYEYRGNVRELKNLVERLAILSDGPEIGAADVQQILPAAPARPGTAASRYQPGKTFHEMVEDAEREIIVAALARSKDNVTEAARSLALERGHFYKKMKALGMRRGGDAEPEETAAE